MPPLSPMPGWTRGDVCSERTASERTRSGTLPGELCFPFGDARGLVLCGVPVLMTEGLVDPDEGLLLVLVDVRIAADLGDEVGARVPCVEDPGPDVQRLGRDLERP